METGWNFWQQIIRYLMAWGGTWFMAKGMPEDMVQAFVGGGVAVVGAVWWWLSFRNAKPDANAVV